MYGVHNPAARRRGSRDRRRRRARILRPWDCDDDRDSQRGRGTGIVNGVFLPIVFISGTFFPVASSNVLAKIAEWFPVRHFIDAMFMAFDPGHQSANGFNGNDLLIMAAWGAGAVILASYAFAGNRAKVECGQTRPRSRPKSD